jgi:serine/threonine-protein kinase
VLVAALIAVGAFLAVQEKIFTASHPLPRITGLTVAQADRRLQAEGLSTQVVRRRFSTTIPAGVILRQIPGPGTMLKEGTAVDVVTSGGPPPVPVPDLSQVHGTCSDFTEALATEHLHADCVPTASTTVPAGAVIHWSPRGEVPEFTTVKVAISTGPPFVPIPSLQGITTCQGVSNALSAAHLRADCSLQYNATVPQGQVVSEHPSSQAQLGSTVTVVLSQGPPPVTIPPLQKSLSDELNLLQQLGLIPGTINGPGNGRPTGTTPPPGASVPPGTTVDISTSGHTSPGKSGGNSNGN